MADDRVRLPSGMGGLVRYSDESTSKIQFKPGIVIFFIVLIIVLEFLLHRMGSGLLG